ncbi:3'-5' exonuclease [uncultured Roseibium sp.]|uniref:3'-5' exonuclease n=1 Tax=uncultured Roseibium sp. TaxID=1936171 RepID=UPI00262E4F92|nr:3'-5' exonuclease [uncultured Roseibium sp.]
MNEPVKHLMIDIETLGTSGGAKILSVAATPFSNPWGVTIEKHEPFYEKINSKSYALNEGWYEDEGTVEWWAGQSEDARSEAFSGTREPESVMVELAAFITELNPATVWAKGFMDTTMLEWAFKKYGIKTPWHYRAPRCLRTVLKTFGSELDCGSHYLNEAGHVPHNPVHDNDYQIAQLEELFTYTRLVLE